MSLMLFQSIPIYNVFTMILIISANWMAALYPCRFRTLLTNNMYIRHLFGFFTMIFFVVLSNKALIPNLKLTFFYAITLYTFFLLMLRTPLMIFLCILFLLLVCYILNMKKEEIVADPSIEDKLKAKQVQNIEYINNATTAITCVFLLFGVTVYLGQKKIEYKSKFNYTIFLLGKSDCLDTSPKTSYISGILHSFD
jgi:hypothetical protein